MVFAIHNHGAVQLLTTGVVEFARRVPPAFHDRDSVAKDLLDAADRVLDEIIVFDVVEGLRREPELRAILVREGAQSFCPLPRPFHGGYDTRRRSAVSMHATTGVVPQFGFGNISQEVSDTFHTRCGSAASRPGPRPVSLPWFADWSLAAAYLTPAALGIVFQPPSRLKNNGQGRI